MNFHDKLPNPIQKIGELEVIKTPTNLVNDILDTLPAHVWGDKNKRWLIPASKTGIFELGIYIRLMKGLAEKIIDREERRAWIVREMIYSFTPTYACELLVKRNYLGKVWNCIKGYGTLEGNVQSRDFLKTTIVGKKGIIMPDKNGKEQYVEFHNIVGNPPYQDNSEANDPKNIYPDFVLKSISLKPEYMSMVIPARWMMGSGKGIQEFLDTMLASKSISKIIEEKDSSKWFPDVSIMGGIMYFLYDSKHNSKTTSINGIDTNLEGEDCIITDPLGLTIKTKVLAKSKNTFDKVMLGGCPFDIRSTHKEWTNSIVNSYVCHNSGKGDSAKTCFIAKSILKKNVEYIDKYKVCMAAGYGSDGTSKPFVIEPNHVVSQSYLVMGCFTSEQDAHNAAKFFHTYLAQYLISLLKNTQNLAKRVFKYLPYLDFSRLYTDQDLYTMFDLSAGEIAHIEKTTKNFPIFKTKINNK